MSIHIARVLALLLALAVRRIPNSRLAILVQALSLHMSRDDALQLVSHTLSIIYGRCYEMRGEELVPCLHDRLSGVEIYQPGDTNGSD